MLSYHRSSLRLRGGKLLLLQRGTLGRVTVMGFQELSANIFIGQLLGWGKSNAVTFLPCPQYCLSVNMYVCEY